MTCSSFNDMILYPTSTCSPVRGSSAWSTSTDAGLMLVIVHCVQLVTPADCNRSGSVKIQNVRRLIMLKPCLLNTHTHARVCEHRPVLFPSNSNVCWSRPKFSSGSSISSPPCSACLHTGTCMCRRLLPGGGGFIGSIQ